MTAGGTRFAIWDGAAWTGGPIELLPAAAADATDVSCYAREICEVVGGFDGSWEVPPPPAGWTRLWQGGSWYSEVVGGWPDGDEHLTTSRQVSTKPRATLLKLLSQKLESPVFASTVVAWKGV